MTSLDAFVSQGWQDHAGDAEAVMARLPQGVELVTEAAHVPALAALVVHVAGEHLGRWSDGLKLLEGIERLPVNDPASPGGKALLRSKAVLLRCAGDRAAEAQAFEASRSGGSAPAASDRIRLLTVAASALLGQKRLAEASADFEEAVALASYGPDASDPASRSLAVTGHNLACDLEVRPSLSDGERALMLRAAAVSRKYWEIAGGWMQVERAEYRLAMSHLKAGDAGTALGHARECLRVVAANGSDPGEAFFAHEVVARSLHASGDVEGARGERDAMKAILPDVADASFRESCASTLAEIEVLVSAS